MGCWKIFIFCTNFHHIWALWRRLVLMVPTIHHTLTFMIILDVSLSRRILLEWSICIPTLIQAEKRAESWQLSQKYAKISPQFWNIGSKQDELLRALLSDHHNHWWFILTHKYLGPIPQKDFQNRSNQVPIFIERKCCAIKKTPCIFTW